MRENQQSEEVTYSDQLSELKKDVNIHSSLLFHIVSNDDQFITKLKDLNESGVSCILQQRYEESLIYFQQAQKVLEFAANCGKTMDRIFIIYTLQNVACAYSKLWELEKASSYLQGIIFQMNSFVENAPEMVMMSEIVDSFSDSYNDFSIFINKRQSIALNYLKFSAINSQLKKHQIALDSAFKALSGLKQICGECYSYEEYAKKEHPSFEIKMMLKELSVVKQTVEIKKTNEYFKLAQKYLKKIKIKNSQTENKKQFDSIAKFSIGEIMQVCPISISQLERPSSLEKEVSYIQKLKKAIYISICYFTIAAQLRFICEEKYGEEKRKVPEYLRSKLFHLNSIIIVCKYLPKKIDYIDHLLKSFNTHYEVKLEEAEFGKEDEMDWQNLIVQNYNEINEEKVLKPNKINNFTNEKSMIQYAKTPDKKKKRSNSKKSKSKHKSFEKFENPNFMKGSFQNLKGKNLFLFDKSKEKKKQKMSPINYRIKEKTSKGKSMNKSKSNSKRELTYEKSQQKRKKKSNKLYEEYFGKFKIKKKSVPKMVNVLKSRPQESMKGSTSKEFLKLGTKMPIFKNFRQ